MDTLKAQLPVSLDLAARGRLPFLAGSYSVSCPRQIQKHLVNVDMSLRRDVSAIGGDTTFQAATGHYQFWS